MKFLQPFVASAVLMTATLAHGQSGLESEMNSMFGTMTNITDPQISMGTRRGSLTGGAYSMRGGVKSFNALTIEPPSFQAGCGGIDAYFGSMSWASKEQVIEMMRSIASNAAGYAFSLALASACPDCDAQIKDYAASLTQWTGYLKDSCTAAKSLMADSGGKEAAQSAGNWFGTFIGTTSGSSEDAFASQSTTQDGPSAADKAAADDPEEFKDAVQANVVWIALKKQPIQLWWGNDSDTLREEIMSMTGSVVSCHLANSPGCGQSGSTPPSDTNGMVTYTLQPTIQLSDLVFGGRDGMATRYKCNDDDCYGPGEEGFPFKGFDGKVSEMFFGADGSGGIIAAMESPTGSLTAEQMSFLVAAGPLGAAIVRTAKVDIGAARQVAKTLGPKIALDLGYTLAQNAIKTAQASTSQMYGAVSSVAVETLRTRGVDLAEDYRKIDNELQANLWALDYARAVVSFLPPMPVPSAQTQRGY